jgi:hypothetical protein
MMKGRIVEVEGTWGGIEGQKEKYLIDKRIVGGLKLE